RAAGTVEDRRLGRWVVLEPGAQLVAKAQLAGGEREVHRGPFGGAWGGSPAARRVARARLSRVSSRATSERARRTARALTPRASCEYHRAMPQPADVVQIVPPGRLVYGMQLPIQAQSTIFAAPWEESA